MGQGKSGKIDPFRRGAAAIVQEKDAVLVGMAEASLVCVGRVKERFDYIDVKATAYLVLKRLLSVIQRSFQQPGDLGNFAVGCRACIGGDMKRLLAFYFR